MIKNLFLLIEECNLSFPNNKMLSSKHGFIEKHDDDKVWLVDTSRNGIIVNMKKKLNNSVILKLLRLTFVSLLICNCFSYLET